MFGPVGWQRLGQRLAEREVDFLLIGGGLAAANCAAELRKRGADGSVLLVGREPEPPYERPPLSKEYLRGEAERADAYVNPPSWYEENDVELLSGTNVMSLDPEARTAKLQGGDEVSFGKALIATGAMVNILRVEGAENEGIHYLRAFGNSDAIRADAEAAEHVVLIGGSYIGAEVAASLTAKGTKCTIVTMEDVALSRTFGEDAGRWFHQLLESKGVTIHGGEELEAYEGDGRVKGGRDQERPGDRVRRGRRRRRRPPRRDARPARRPRGRRRHRLRLEAAELGRGHLRRRRLLLLRQRHPRPPPAGRALGRGDAAGHPRRPQHARRRTPTTRSSPTSSATSPTGPASSTSAPPASGTRRSGAATARRASSPSGTSRTARSPAPSASSAPKTWPRPAACSPTASTSPAPRIGSPIPTAIFRQSAPDPRSSRPSVFLVARVAPWCNWQHASLWSWISGFESLGRSFEIPARASNRSASFAYL